MRARRFAGAAPEVEQGSIYLAISDLMSGLLMVFVLLVLALMLSLQERIEKVEKRRIVIIRDLQSRLEDEGIRADVNEETGDVSILDSILFDEGRATLKGEGRDFIDRFIPVYSAVIFSKPEYDEEIVRVVVEGHTSSKGSFPTNMGLSLSRAESVLHYIHDDLVFEHQTGFQGKLVGAGRGEIQARQDVDAANDRKVVFRLQFKGLQIEEILDQGRTRFREDG